MPWVALKKPPRKRPTRLVRWRAAVRERMIALTASGLGLAMLLGFWFVVARGAAG